VLKIYFVGVVARNFDMSAAFDSHSHSDDDNDGLKLTRDELRTVYFVRLVL
jgi:hypothetical protein